MIQVIIQKIRDLFCAQKYACKILLCSPWYLCSPVNLFSLSNCHHISIFRFIKSAHISSDCGMSDLIDERTHTRLHYVWAVCARTTTLCKCVIIVKRNLLSSKDSKIFLIVIMYDVFLVYRICTLVTEMQLITA